MVCLRMCVHDAMTPASWRTIWSLHSSNSMPLLPGLTARVPPWAVDKAAVSGPDHLSLGCRQLTELQKGLQLATESMLKLPPEPSPRSTADSAPQAPSVSSPADGGVLLRIRFSRQLALLCSDMRHVQWLAAQYHACLGRYHTDSLLGSTPL